MSSRIEQLIRDAQSGQMSAREALILENSGLIWSVARRFLGRGVESDDLYQLGCVGFLKAVDGFDVEFGTQFSTYAVPKISGEIRRFLRDDGSIKVSRNLKEQALTIRTARNQLLVKLGREPSLNELSERTGFTAEQIAAADLATNCVESIQKENGDVGFSLENVLSDTESEETLVEKISLKQGIEKLHEREAMVVRLRYFHGLTQERVSKVLQVSQVQVSRIEKKALTKLRELLE